MPLPPPDTAREPLHTRTIRVQSYARADGLWDLDAELLDVKAYDFETHRGTHAAGEPVHRMFLRVTIDASYTIAAAQAAYDNAPYGNCAAIAPDYEALVGLNLLRGFRQQVKARFGRVTGCTHLSELSWVLPTAAVQSLAGQRAAVRQHATHERPFQLDGCHALKVSGPVVKTLYPQWFVAEDLPAQDAAAPTFSLSHTTDR